MVTMHALTVRFLPSGRKVSVLPGTILLEAAEMAGLILQTPCGGSGTCGKCRVTIDGQDVLACTYKVEADVVVNVPAASLFTGGQHILVSDAGRGPHLVDPVVRMVPFVLEAPTQHDAASDLARLQKAVGPDLVCRMEVLMQLPRALRAGGWRGRAVVSDTHILGIEPAEGDAPVLGVAFDLGTTTVVGTLIDLQTGAERGLAARMNGQICLGDDVVTRIACVREDHAAGARMQQLVVATLQAIVDELAGQAGVKRDRIYEVVVAGNATMQQLLLGIDCGALGEVPFVQAFSCPVRVVASAVGLQVHSGAELQVFGQIGGFVGGDTVACIVATQLERQAGAHLLVDIGTNGEIVLSRDGKMYAASTAAGPAFEGARIRQGMRAVPGAIEKVLIGEDVTLHVIGNVAPAGLCGTALIDTVAELLRVGVLDETGRFRDADEMPATVSDAVRARLQHEGVDCFFVLADAQMAAGSEAVCLWQRDVRELQLAAGAIRAGISILLQRAGLVPEDLVSVLLAGAFGNYIRRHQARRIGLLPAMAEERIHFVGNASSLGAKMVLLTRTDRARAAELAEKVEHVDLSLDPEFSFEFSMAMMFPGPEADGDFSGVL
jgi:uncharacterized 2Fe-2S/4Fe-4S cluster protein (DUF4445 family)